MSESEIVKRNQAILEFISKDIEPKKIYITNFLKTQKKHLEFTLKLNGIIEDAFKDKKYQEAKNRISEAFFMLDSVLNDIKFLRDIITEVSFYEPIKQALEESISINEANGHSLESIADIIERKKYLQQVNQDQKNAVFLNFRNDSSN